MRNALPFLALAIALSACNSKEKQLFLADDLYWHQQKRYVVTAEGEIKDERAYHILNVLDHPHYEHWFMKFKDNGELEQRALASHKGSEENFTVQWQMEANDQIRYGRKNEPLDPQDPQQLWTIDSLSEDVLILSLDMAYGGKMYQEYGAKKMHIPGRDKVEEVPSQASEGALERGLKIEKISSAEYDAKRDELFSLDPEKLGVGYHFAEGQVLIVGEYTEHGESVMVSVNKQGISEVYFSQGLKFTGGHNIQAIKDLNFEYLSNSGRLWELRDSLHVDASPAEGKIRYNIVSTSAGGGFEIDLNRARGGSDDFIIVTRAMQGIIDKYKIALSTL